MNQNSSNLPKPCPSVLGPSKDATECHAERTNHPSSARMEGSTGTRDFCYTIRTIVLRHSLEFAFRLPESALKGDYADVRPAATE